MTDQPDVHHLKEQLSELSAQQRELRAQLARMQLEQWQGRIDDLELQAHLGSLEIDERVAPLVEELRTRWLGAADDIRDAPDTAVQTIEVLRDGFERAIGDARAAIVEATHLAIGSR